MQRKPSLLMYIHLRCPSTVISGIIGAIDFTNFCSRWAFDTASRSSITDSTFDCGPLLSFWCSFMVSRPLSKSIHLRDSKTVHILALPMTALYRVDGARQGCIVSSNGGIMGRRVSNIYGKTANPEIMTLEVISNGIYDIEILFETKFHELLAKYSWCFEQSKGLVYMMDLTLDLPTKMGYNTARVYLRDFIMFHAGIWGDGVPSHIWERKLENYALAGARLLPISYPRQNNT